VTAASFDTTIDGESSNWALELGRYGDEFVIEPPANIRAATPTVTTASTETGS
jgi:hypothetical protein